MKMTCGYQSKVIGESDDCNVQMTATGKISVGSIVLKPEEADEFLVLLGEAIRALQESSKDKPANG